MSLAGLTFFLQIATKQKADERTRTADLISSYEYESLHFELYVVVAKSHR
jgi:hypothetical protein